MTPDIAAMFARVRANAEKACFEAGDLFEIMQVIATAERFTAGEAKLRAREDGHPNEGPEGTADSLATCAAMLATYAAELFPPNEQGRVHFARVMMDSTAAEIRAFLVAQQILPESTKFEAAA